jgi:hypothetical protein
VGWDWSEHRGDFETGSGVRWGEFVVTGSIDGSEVTPSSIVPASEAEPPPDLPDEPEFSTPCPEPDGGWQVVDPELTTQDTMQRTFAAAERLDGYAESWMDQSINPAWDPEHITEDPRLNDPTKLVINVRVTEHPEDAEATLREVWGGALCVSTAEHTMDELQAIQDEVNDLPGMLSSSPGDGMVELGVVYDDGTVQAWTDATYGARTVLVYSALQDVGQG